MNSIEDIKAMTDRSISESREARRMAELRRKKHRRKMRYLSLLAVAGLVIIVSQITADKPQPLLVLLGILMVVPVIVEWSEG